MRNDWETVVHTAADEIEKARAEGEAAGREGERKAIYAFALRRRDIYRAQPRNRLARVAAGAVDALADDIRLGMHTETDRTEELAEIIEREAMRLEKERG